MEENKRVLFVNSEIIPYTAVGEPRLSLADICHRAFKRLEERFVRSYQDMAISTSAGTSYTKSSGSPD